MIADSTVRARINGKIKEEASIVLESMGLTMSDAVRLMLTRVANEKAFPFDMRVPNAETIAAMRACRAGEGKSFNSVDELMADLNAPD